MFKNLRLLSLLLVFTLVFPFIPVKAQAYENPAPDNFRAVWVTSVYNLDYPAKPTTDPDVLKKEADAILDNAKASGLNAVILQVRPSADAFYKSSIFPWSIYLTGKQDTAPKNSFDPLEYWISGAHKRGLTLHAWVNPYRVTKKKDAEWSSLSKNNPAKKNPSWVVKHTDGNYYFNPGIPEVRKLVVNGVMEILKNYDIDGIHLDDYFYPSKDFSDSATFKTYGGQFKSVAEWRRNNVNMLVKELDDAIHKEKPKCVFGVSPAGIWANRKTDSRGSATAGYESYTSNYADSVKWVENGWVDYICPQIYWAIGQKNSDYSILLNWWSNIVKNRDVKLYVGIAAYRAGNKDTKSAWFGTSEITRQLKLNQSNANVSGEIYFRSAFLKSVVGLSETISAFYNTSESATVETPASTGTSDNSADAGQGLRIGRPSNGISTTYSKFYIAGTSNPKLDLTINGKPISGRSSLGYFGVLVDLSVGVNTFALRQGTQTATLKITRKVSSASPLSSASISSAFPKSDEMGRPGDRITLKCTAPIGAAVRVKINGKTYTMTPATKNSPNSAKIYGTTYSYSYVLPNFSGNPRNVSLGKPVYTMTYKGKTSSVTAGAPISVILYSSPYVAEVTAQTADTYFSASSANGSDGEVYKGQKAFVSAVSGSYAKLITGSWVKKSAVKLSSASSGFYPEITAASYTKGDKFDKISFKLSSSSVTQQSFDGKKLTLTFPSAAKVSGVALPNDSPFETASAHMSGIAAVYAFTLKSGQSIDGYYTEPTSEGLDLYIKHPIKASDGDLPLKGITIMLDPGHGGKNSGAVGPRGSEVCEKDINLASALKVRAALQSRGATVLMTRENDTELTLEAILAKSRKARPDIFLSVHANSLDDNADLSKVSGLAVFYRGSLSKNFAQSLFDVTKSELSRPDKGIFSRNHYVTKGTWCPSAIYESGFVPNPQDFEWLTDESAQTKLAESLANAIVKSIS